MDTVLQRKNVTISLGLLLALFVLISGFLWLKLNNANAERRYLWYLVGKQRELEKLLTQENAILKKKAHIPADRAVIAMEKKKTSKGNRGFLFWKGTAK